MSRARVILAGVFLSIGIMIALLALLVFASLIISGITHTYEGGAQAITQMFLYALLAVPATLCCSVAVALRGWRDARAGYVTLACLYGIPLLVFVVAIICMVFDALKHKFAA